MVILPNSLLFPGHFPITVNKNDTKRNEKNREKLHGRYKFRSLKMDRSLENNREEQLTRSELLPSLYFFARDIHVFETSAGPCVMVPTLINDK
jgi:hypothetical protein